MPKEWGTILKLAKKEKKRDKRKRNNTKNDEKLKIEAKKINTFKQGKALGEQFIVKPKQKSKAKKKA